MHAYLGPRGTFTHAALVRHSGSGEGVPAQSVPEALDLVRAGKADRAVVPFENSVEGSVSATLDALSRGDELHVVAEVLLPVTFDLLVRPGTTLETIRTVTTHPHAEAQCRRWLREHLPGASFVPAASTADAARAVADGEHTGAVASSIAGELYSLEALETGVEDNDGAVTRFVVAAAPGSTPAPTGADRTTFTVHVGESRPGALHAVLTEFYVRKVNLSRIESRPAGRLGEYTFSIDAEGHVEDERLGEALAAVERSCGTVRYLGSYPRADAEARAAGDEEYAAGAAWLESIRSRSRRLR